MKSSAKNFKFIILAAFILISGCATQYGPLGLTGGYKEMQLNPTTYKVTFRGNGFTSESQVSQDLLRRCAQLTKLKGYNYFIVSKQKVSSSNYIYQTPAQVQTTSYGTNMGNINNNGFGNYSYNGNNSYYANSTIRPSQAYDIQRYTTTAIMTMLKNKPTTSTNYYDANIILNQFKNGR